MFNEKTVEPQEKNKKKNRIRIVLLIVFGVLVIASVGFGIKLLTDSEKTSDNEETGESVVEHGTALSGVSVNGIDISGMTYEQAEDATAALEQTLLSEVEISLDVSGEIYEYTADDLNLSTDYQAVLAQAMDYGHSGTFEERRQAADTTKRQGVDFPVSLNVDDARLQSVLAQLTQTHGQPPQDATVIFTPNGHEVDGSIFEPDPKEMADLHAKGKQIQRPELIRTDDADQPYSLRYQFWNEDEYEEGYIPVDADIARFLYTPDIEGIAADTDAVRDEIMAQVQSGEYSPINVPVNVTDAEVTLEQLKEDTQLICSWTSSYRKHSKENRVWNVSRMSSFINGAKILPGEEWSVNDTAGPRNSKTAREIGWKKAGGLYQGGTTQQYGGGVCQLGSTTYNAALRADLTIAEFWHHSDPSSYISKGLDATLESGAKDLVLRNDGETPVYLVSYVDPEKKIVTVEVYGRLPYNEEYKQHVIYDYTSDNKGTRYGSGGVRKVYATETPNHQVLSPEVPTIKFSLPKRGHKVEVFKHIYALDGTELEKTLLRISDYKPINGYTYIYPPELMPTPTPTPTPVVPTPTPATPTPTPATPTPTPATPTPTPATPTPTPATPTPTPATPTPTPATPTPTPATPTPTPATPTPTPATPTSTPPTPTPDPTD